MVDKSVDDAYLDLVRRVLDEGTDRPDRTGTGIRSLFGAHMSVPLDPFPLVAVKRTFFRGVVEELLWMLRGMTNANELAARKVHIWDANAHPDALRQLGLSYPKGELGPIYGWQWRHWGSKYPVRFDAREPGVDQIARLLRGLREDPYGRRHVVCAWNAGDLDKMALPPCHFAAQWYVSHPSERKTLHCQFSMRSCDVGLGLPFNLASYATLTHMIAHVLDMDVGHLHVSLGDVHVYRDHIEDMKRLCDAPPDTRQNAPRLTFRCVPKSDPAEYEWSDLELTGYVPGPSIALPMAV